MPKLFQIYEDDLAELEKELPRIADALTPILTPTLRVKVRRCQTILSQVRWNYGPHEEVEIIPAGDE